MEVKTGYKQTELGVIPEDWYVSKIESIIDEISMGPFGSDIKVSNFISSGIPVLNGANVVSECLVDSFENFVSLEKAMSFKKAVARKGDIVVTHRGTIGQIAYIPEDSEFNRYVISQSQFRVRFLQDVVIPAWVVLFFHSENGSKMLLEGKGHTGVPAIAQPTRTFRNLCLPLPSLPEQRAIAGVLSDVDGLIVALEKLIAKKQAIKQAAMQQLLTGNTRLSGFIGKWETKCLGELGTFLKGKGIKRDDISDEGVACVRYGELYTDYHNYLTAPKSRIPAAVAVTALPINYGDLLFAGSGETAEEIGKCVTYLGEEPAYAGGDIVVLRLSSQNASYLGHLLNHPVVAKQKSRFGQGDAVVHISARNLAQVEVKLPPIEEQTAITTILFNMDAEIEAWERRLDKTKQIKQGMMQQLLSGRIRLVKPEVAHAPIMETETNGNEVKPHSWAFNEAVVISTLSKHFGKEDFPLGRKRYTKLSYLLHRHSEHQAEGYLKKAAGPYNPQTKYGGPERIALESCYIREHKNGPYSGFVASDNIAQAETYFEKWYGSEAIQWLNQFRFKKNDDLELLATVDMAAEELRNGSQQVDVPNVKALIRSHSEWKAKLDREVFSDTNIARAIKESQKLFGKGGER